MSGLQSVNTRIYKIVSRSSAVIPGASSSEVLCFSKDHKEMVRFEDSDDDDFQTIVSHLLVMIGLCEDKIALNFATLEKSQPNIMDNGTTPNSFTTAVLIALKRRFKDIESTYFQTSVSSSSCQESKLLWQKGPPGPNSSALISTPCRP
jgi:hypothetical protein